MQADPCVSSNAPSLGAIEEPGHPCSILFSRQGGATWGVHRPDTGISPCANIMGKHAFQAHFEWKKVRLLECDHPNNEFICQQYTSPGTIYDETQLHQHIIASLMYASKYQQNQGSSPRCQLCYVLLAIYKTVNNIVMNDALRWFTSHWKIAQLYWYWWWKWGGREGCQCSDNVVISLVCVRKAIVLLFYSYAIYICYWIFVLFIPYRLLGLPNLVVLPLI